MTRRVLLHVGTPKTGTSLLQHALFSHRDRLREAGVLYPAERPDAHFLAALDLMQLPWGGLEREARGAWDRLAASVREWPGTSVVSHEILGAATGEQAGRALDDLTGDLGGEVHLVVSARDLARQVPAEWQENLKHRRTATYADFLAALRDPVRPTRVSRWFWDVQWLPDLLERWGSGLPAERVHVVTVPPRGSDPTALWGRFLEAFDLAGHDLVPEGRANPSLGVAESAMLRRLNVRLNGGSTDESGHDSASAGLPSDHYRPLVRELLVHRNLGERVGSDRLVLPPEVRPWIAERSREAVAALRERGYVVHGDLEDLLVDETSGPDDPAISGATSGATSWADPDAGAEHPVAEAALDALALMTEEAARLRDVEHHLRERERHLGEEVADQRAQLDRLYGTPGYRTKERLVAMSGTNPVVRGAYAAYRRIRGSSSRST